MESYFLTDTGKVRNHNEDAVKIVKNKTSEYLMAVADGMGGHKAGEVAATMVVDYLTNEFVKSDSIGTKEEAIGWIRKNISICNDNIFKYTEEHQESKGMGTTIVVSIVTSNYILFGNVGDSSGYVIKEDKLYKVTKDHTLVSLLMENGELTIEQAENHPKKNVLMRALGANNPIDVDIFDVDIKASSIILCSDGLTSLLNDEQIEKVITNKDYSSQEKVIRLIKKSNIRGGTDNISIAYLNRKAGVAND